MIKTGTIGDMVIPAGGTMEVVIDALPVDIREDADYFIRFSATQNQLLGGQKRAMRLLPNRFN